MISVESFASALVHFLWQGALLALVAWFAFSMTRSPQLRYVIGIVMFALMPLAVILTLLGAGRTATVVPLEQQTSHAAVSRSPISSGESQIRANGPVTNRPAMIPPAATTARESFQRFFRPVANNSRFIVALWVVGALLMSLRLLAGLRLTTRRLRSAVSEGQWPVIVDRLRARLGIGRAVRILESAAASTPVVMGWLRPVILRPVSAVSGLTPRQIEILIAHELAHVARHDYVVNLIQSAIEALLFFHPAVWWLSRRIREERELCCDDLAIRVTGDAREFAEALYALEGLRASGLAQGATGGNLMHRIRRLVDPGSGRNETFSRWAAGALVILVLTATGLGGWLSQLSAALHATDVQSEPALAQHQTSGSKEHSENVISAPDPSRSLGDRMTWAKAEADRRGDRTYWVVYTIQPLAWIQGALYIGGEATMVLEGETMHFSGVLSATDPSQLKIDGTPLAHLFAGNPKDIAVMLQFRGTKSSSPVQQVVASLSLAHNFDDHPIYWLGPAQDRESIAMARHHFDGARKSEDKANDVALMGVHASSDLVVPELLSILKSNNPTNVRTEAAQWLGRHPRQEALRALDVAARTDRSPDVQREAAESIGEMKLPEAFDVLRKLAHELDSIDVRREAVESLGKRPEADAAKVLHQIAVEDENEDIRREAVESLGDLDQERGWDALSDLLEHSKDESVRSEAAETVGQAANPSKAIPALRKVIEEDPSNVVTNAAVEALAEMKDGQGIDAVMELAGRSPDPELRAFAVEEIAPQLAPDAATEWLKDVIENDRSSRVRLEAVETLGDLQNPRALDLLTTVAGGHPDSAVRREAVETLGDYKKDALSIFKRLVVKEQSSDVLAEIFETALELEDPAAVSFVRGEAKNHPDPAIRTLADQALEDR